MLSVGYYEQKKGMSVGGTSQGRPAEVSYDEGPSESYSSCKTHHKPDVKKSYKQKKRETIRETKETDEKKQKTTPVPAS